MSAAFASDCSILAPILGCAIYSNSMEQETRLFHKYSSIKIKAHEGGAAHSGVDGCRDSHLCYEP